MTDITFKIAEARKLIREHRDQIGDYRCWVDDDLLHHAILPELSNQRPNVPGSDEFMRRCEAYHALRQNPNELPVAIPLDSSVGQLQLRYDTKLDDDLRLMDEVAKKMELDKIIAAVRHHRARGYQGRTFEDDASLYMLLPEKQPAITQLPPREKFIGKGCPAYNAFCQKHPEQFASATWQREE